MPRKSSPLITPNLIALSVNKAVNDNYKRSKSLAHNAVHPVPLPTGNGPDEDEKSPPSSPETTSPHRARNIRFSRAKSQSNSPRGSQSRSPRSYKSFSSSGTSPATEDKEEMLRRRLRQQRRSGFSTKEVTINLQRVAQQRQRKGNYLESVVVIKIEKSTVNKLIEVVTENDFKIRCSESQLFWIMGRGWGAFDAENRNQQEDDEKSKIHLLKPGEKLLTVSGNKYRISHINVVEEPQGIECLSVIVAKNDCFFANDLLLKNAQCR